MDRPNRTAGAIFGLITGHGAASGRGVVGRHAEIEAVESFLERARSSVAVLDVEGEAGIGKTTLWRLGVELAGRSEMTVLTARPAETDRDLSLLGLADLLDPLEPAVIDVLPEPQGLALRAALLQRGAPPEGVDERALSTAVLSVIRDLCRRRPLLVAVDDAQWLDPPSAGVLGFVLRRLSREPVGFLVTTRGEPGKDHPGFARVSGLESGDVLSLGGLSLGALHELIKQRLGRSFPRPVLVRISQASGGNPFYALEIAQAMVRHSQPEGLLPVPSGLDELLRGRLADLPGATRRVLLMSAMVARPSPGLIDLDALRPAEQAGIVESDSSRVRFRHPLFAASVYQGAEPGLRRELHAYLAQVVEDPEEQARHLARARTGPDPAVAEALDAAALLALRRGAPQAAAELSEMAVEKTPGAAIERQAERLLAAAHHWFDAGDLTRSESLIASALDHLAEGGARCRALSLESQIHFRRNTLSKAVETAKEAQRQPADPGLLARVELDLAFLFVNLADFGGAVEYARSAVEKLGRSARTGLLAEARAALTITEFLAGEGLDEGRLRWSLQHEDPSRRPAWQMRPSFIAGCIYLFSGRLDEAVPLLESLHEHAVQTGQESVVAVHSMYLVWGLVWQGRLGRAEQVAAEARTTASLLGDPISLGSALTAHALVHALDGSHRRARDEALEAIAVFDELNWRAGVIFPAWALGLALTVAGDPAAVDDVLGPVAALMIGPADADPSLAMFLPEEIESLVSLGRYRDAERLVEWLEHRAGALDRPVSLAGARRGRALLLSAQGDQAAAWRSLEQALVEHSRVDMPIEKARTQLAGGMILRRLGRRSEARGMLLEARRSFESAGSPAWAERVGAEIARLGARRRPPGELTTTESLIAELAAAGCSNREIAARAYLSVKAVEANLTRIYRKLGLRSRGGLARALDDPRQEPSDGPPPRRPGRSAPRRGVGGHPET